MIARQRGKTDPCLRRGTRPIGPERRRIVLENRVVAAGTMRLKIAAVAAAVPLWGGILTAAVCAVA